MILADISSLPSKQNHFTQLKISSKINTNLQALSLEFKDKMPST